MPSTTSCSFGDVLLVPFPFTDQTTSKQRPAVVISSAEYNRGRSDVIVMAVTSQFRARPGFGDAVVRDWRVAGLIKPSVLKPVVTTLAKGLMIRKLGSLSAHDRDTLRKVVKQIVGE